MMPYDHTEHTVKIVVWGPAEAGKTSLLLRRIHDSFSENYKATRGVDFAQCKIEVGNADMRLQLWDIAGNELYGNMTSILLKQDTSAVILVYDLTDKESPEKINKYLEKVKQVLGESIPIFIVGNKCDLANKMKLSENLAGNICGNFETSAKDNTQVKALFESVAKTVSKRITMGIKISDTLEKIQEQITRLTNDLQGDLVLNRERKEKKITGLEFLKTQIEQSPDTPMKAHVRNALEQHPTLVDGVSSDVRKLLESLIGGSIESLNEDQKANDENCLVM